MHNRILQAAVELDTARQNWLRVKRECEKERRQCPSHLYDKHMAEIALFERNLAAAEAAEYAMRRYPPIRVFR